MKYGICQWNLPVNGPEGCYELVKCGLDGMELNYTNELLENIDEYCKIAGETGVEFPTLGMNNFCDRSYICEGSEAYFEKEIATALKCALKLGVKTLQIPAFAASDIKTGDELCMAAKNLRKACELAEPYGIYICTENALDAEQNSEFFKLVNHPLFKFYFDNQNLWRMKGKHCAEVLELMKDHIVEAHAKDSLVIDGNQTWLPLGEGDGEFYSSMEFLKNKAFSGWIHLENDYQTDAEKNPLDFDYIEAIKKDLNTLKSIF